MYQLQLNKIQFDWQIVPIGQSDTDGILILDVTNPRTNLFTVKVYMSVHVFRITFDIVQKENLDY